eukprot:5283436-Pleurochrysis_carterae.AAC.3
MPTSTVRASAPSCEWAAVRDHQIKLRSCVPSVSPVVLRRCAHTAPEWFRQFATSTMLACVQMLF